MTGETKGSDQTPLRCQNGPKQRWKTLCSSCKLNMDRGGSACKPQVSLKIWKTHEWPECVQTHRNKPKMAQNKRWNRCAAVANWKWTGGKCVHTPKWALNKWKTHTWPDSCSNTPKLAKNGTKWSKIGQKWPKNGPKFDTKCSQHQKSTSNRGDDRRVRGMCP